MRIEQPRMPGQDKGRAQRIAVLQIVTNLLEIAAALVMVFLVMRMIGGQVETTLARSTALVCFSIVGWGALRDILAGLDSLNALQREQALMESYMQMEALNREMRAQRHDFLNHIQVIYSLIEMEEPQEALHYIDELYADMHRVSRSLRTGSPAVNALLQAKMEQAKDRGIDFVLNIGGKWEDPGMPTWEICRVLANLIDNAMDAAQEASAKGGEAPRVELVTGEDAGTWFFSVRNNGPAIPKHIQERLFEAGITTKQQGHGMGLYIVKRLVSEMGGEITLDSQGGNTVFSAFVPRSRLQLTEGKKEQAS